MTDNLRDASRRAGTNAVFRRLAVEDFPGELAVLSREVVHAALLRRLMGGSEFRLPCGRRSL